MKVAIVSDDQVGCPLVSRTFAHCNFFAIYDTETERVEFIANPFSEKEEYAGEEAALFLVNMGVKRVVGYDIDPRARQIMDANRIKLVVPGKDGMAVDEVLSTMTE